MPRFRPPAVRPTPGGPNSTSSWRSGTTPTGRPSVGSGRAKDITNVPAGDITANNVQDALNQLDTNKVDSVTCFLPTTRRSSSRARSFVSAAGDPPSWMRRDGRRLRASRRTRAPVRAGQRAGKTQCRSLRRAGRAGHRDGAVRPDLGPPPAWYRVWLEQVRSKRNVSTMSVTRSIKFRAALADAVT